MKKPWQVWTVFGVCLAIAVAGMAWLSHRVTELERAESQRNARADFEGNVRLALGRMDLAVSQLLAEQSAWPYLAYQPWYRPPSAGNKQPPLAISPLSKPASPLVRLYFQTGYKTELQSPGVPPPASKASKNVPEGLAPDQVTRNRKLLGELNQLLDRPRLLAQLPAPKPISVDLLATAEVSQQVADATGSERNGVDPFTSTNGAQQAAQPAPQQDAQSPSQQVRNTQEFNTRAKRYSNQVDNYSVQLQRREQISGNNPIVQQAAPDGPLPTMPTSQVVEGPIRPVWLGSELILARRVLVGGETVLQGCWLDWPAMKQALTAEVADLLPSADLVPVDDAQKADPGRMLATLSAQLVVAPQRLSSWTGSETSPVPMALLAAWIGLALAAVAAALLLHGVLVLSERRAAFVSAVTHELRTPLTTFRMYSEMLSEGMVPDETQRRHYLTTLKGEADRLFHLIENVLSYARLERGRRKVTRTSGTVEMLLRPIVARLSERAARDGMEVEYDWDESATEASLTTDPAAVEQILVNLVDNACKYAAPATDRRIHLDVRRDGTSLRIGVRDHGPGIAATDARRLFRPFTKSARDAAQSAPGVGLGLALSRSLARDLGGTLILERGNAADEPAGASFVLRLPLAVG